MSEQNRRLRAAGIAALAWAGLAAVWCVLVPGGAAELPQGVPGTLRSLLVLPLAEELVFRGVLMRGLKPRGRNCAIVTSALMFGLFHDDVVQGLFAFGCGLLFGFVAMEYSLVWSIVLHVFNNAVLGGVLPWLAGLFGAAGDTAYTLGLLGVSIIGLIVVLVKSGGGLRAYRRVNRSAPGTYWGWTSPAFLIFVIVNVAITILSFVTAMMGV